MGSQTVEEQDCIFGPVDPYLDLPLDGSLSQIRILTLLPATSTQLQGHLRVEVLLPEPPLYEALSYVWGESSKLYTLWVNGTRISITYNLFQALHQIRHPTKSRDLWIDAVCINQRSSNEKNHQVRQMYKIYSIANRVLIWLGEADDSSSDAMAVLGGTGKLTYYYGLPWTQVKSIFERVWWTRVWTFQEAIAANDASLVLCGKHQVPWPTFVSTFTRLRPPPTTNAKEVSISFLLQVLELHNGRKRLTLEDLLWATISREASDPRDLIYALLGPLTGDIDVFEPDYRQPPLWAYQKAMVSMMREAKNLDWILYKIKQGAATPLSWCMDFSNRQGLEDVVRYPAIYPGAASNRSVDNIGHDIHEGVITLTGWVAGTVAASQTLLSDDGPIAHDLIPDLMSSFNRSCWQLEEVRDMYFFSTNTGIIGSGMRMYHVGDVLCILVGCKLPLILRPEPDGLYKIIDAVYAKDLMDGEYLADNKYQEYRVETQLAIR